MDNIQKSINLSIEIEGLLRTLKARPGDDDAYALLLQKTEEFKQLILAREESTFPATETIADAADSDNAAISESVAPSESANIQLEETPAPSDRPTFAAEFSINDKYMFIREIFGGSTADFAEVVNRVEETNTLGDAYDYFLNDLGWDADDETISQFLTIVAKHFNSAQ